MQRMKLRAGNSHYYHFASGMPQIKVFWGFKYLSEFGVILQVCFGCLVCCFVRQFPLVPLLVFLTHAMISWVMCRI